MTTATPAIPQDLAAEQALVGGIMILSTDRSDPVAEVIASLSPDDFFSGAMRRCWQGLVDLTARGESCDSVTLATWLSDRDRLAEVGGMAALARLLNCPSLTERAIAGYARSIRDKANRRRLIGVARRALAEAEASDIPTDELIAKTEEAVHRLGQSAVRKSTTVTMRAAVKSAFVKLREHESRGGGIMGISTGFRELDDALGGLHRGDLTIIAARPAMGKTSLAMAIASNVVEGGKGAAVFTLEMPHEQLAIRAVASDGGVDLGAVRRGQMSPLDWSKLTSAATRICRHEQFYLDDNGSNTLADIATKSRKLQADMRRAGVEIGIVVVDYLQLVSCHGQNREQAVAEVSRGLKALAKELHAPVVALSQLNRALESRNDKRPMMSDLRESGAIEQDSDNILMLYRDDYYNAKSEKPGLCEAIIAKQRNGPTGTVELAFRAATATFRSPSDPLDYHDNPDQRTGAN